MTNEQPIGAKHKISEGYIEVKTEEGWKYEHRYKAEEKLGRELKNDEIVHHKNGDTSDNSIGNLEVQKLSEHSRMHNLEKGKEVAVLECPECGKLFEREKRQTFMSKPDQSAAFCSRSCNGKYYSKNNISPKGEKYLKEVYKN